jgi:hypothetical protein
MSRRLRLSLVVAAVAVVVIAGALLASGAFSSAGSGGDPAKAVPPSAAVYVTTQLNPGGESGDSVRHVLGQVAGSDDDPGPMLRSLADAVLGRVGLSYSGDIAPWVGSRVSAFVSRFGPGFEGAIVAAARDQAAARRVLARTGKPFAVIDGMGIVGTAAAVHAAQRAAETGLSLGHSDRYTQAIGQLGSPVAVLYVDPAKLVEALPASLIGASRQRDLRLRFARIEDKPTVVSMTGIDNNIALDSGNPPAPPAPSNPTPVGGGERGTSLLPTRIIYSLPAQSWLAVDLPEAGQRLFETLSPQVNPGLPNDQLRAFQHRFARATGLRPIEDVVGWIGGTALFAFGTTPATLTAGLVIESLDPDASAHALALLRRFVPRQPGVRVTNAAEGFVIRAPRLVPGPITVIERGNRIAVVYGRDPGAALDAPNKLGMLPNFRDATAQLGGTLLPAGWLTPGRAAAFAGALGLSRSPLFRAAVPYLRRIAYAELGIKRAKRRVVIGSRP